MLRDRLSEAIPRDVETPAPAVVPLWKRLLPVVAVIGAFAAGALLLALIAERVPEDSTTLRFTPFATEARYEGLPTWSPDGQTIAYSAEVDGTLQILTRTLTSLSPAQLTHASYDCKYPFWSADGRRVYYISLAKTRDGIWSVGAAGGTPQVVVENAIRGAISPDGHTLAFLRDEEQADIVGSVALYLAKPQGSEPWSSDLVEAAATRYTGFGDLRFVEGAVAFSPDGRFLGVMAVPNIHFPVRPGTDSTRWRFWVVPLTDGGRPKPRLTAWGDPMPRVMASSLTWLDNRHVVFSVATLSAPGTHLWMADVERDRAWPLTPSADSESFPSSSPRGDRIVFARGEPDYDIVELSASETPPRPVLATTRKEVDPAWSRDGNLMAYVTDRQGAEEIWVRNRVGQLSDRRLIGQGDFVDAENVAFFAPAFSPDSQRIAYLRTGGRGLMALQIYISAEGSPPVRLLPPKYESFQGAPTWSPDGLWIAFAEWKGRERHWDLCKVRVGTGEEPIVLRRDGVPNANPQWSPNGDWITWETETGFVLVSAADGKQERRFDIDQWLVHGWSRDGSSILGIVETEDLRLSLVSVDIEKKAPRVLADLGPSPPVNNPVQGFSMGPDGRTILTSFVRMQGDLWLLEGFRRPESLWRRLWPRWGQSP
jgi:Tol biopolymer transport system component